MVKLYFKCHIIKVFKVMIDYCYWLSFDKPPRIRLNIEIAKARFGYCVALKITGLYIGTFRTQSIIQDGAFAKIIND